MSYHICNFVQGMLWALGFMSELVHHLNTQELLFHLNNIIPILLLRNRGIGTFTLTYLTYLSSNVKTLT